MSLCSRCYLVTGYQMTTGFGSQHHPSVTRKSPPAPQKIRLKLFLTVPSKTITNQPNTDSAAMDFNRPIPKEDIQKLYQRWMQLKQQFGEQATQNAEFIHLSKLLKQISKQQEMARRNMQSAQGGQPQAPQQTQQSPQLQQQRPQPHQQQQQQSQFQQQPPPPPQQQQTQQPNGNALNNGLFAPYQSMLLKAQIAAFKCLVKNVPIPQEVNNILVQSLKNNLKQPTEQSGPQPGQTPQSQPQPPIMKSQPSQIPNTGPHSQQQQSPITSQKNPLVSRPSKPNNSIRTFPDQKPVPLDKMKEQHPDVQTVIPVNDPSLIVDSFTKPSQQESVPYELLYHPKSRVIIPGVFPQGVDVYGSYQIREAKIQLEIESLLDEFNQQLDQQDLNSNNLDDLIDYYSLKLLPFQKAIRGHVLSFNYFKNSLLTNTHPNFLAKNRKITLLDADKTNNLYLQQESQKLSIENKKKTEQIAKLTSDSSHILKQRNEKKDRIAKFGRSIGSLHAYIEKEEQKRIERNAKQRLQALKANDEEAYIKLLDQTKDTRITHLLRQTNQFLDSLAQAVKEQQKDSHQNSKAAGAEEETPFDDDTEENENIDYYSVAHRVKEEIKVQPSILIGGTLKEYQMKGLQWMVSLFNNHLNGILADEMGLGKTIQSISLLTYLYEAKKVPGPFLVIVPLSTLTNWNLEFEKWAPSLKKITYKGTPSVRKVMQNDIRARNFHVLLTTFEYIIKDRPLLSKINWAHMIIDEGHRMKNANSKLSFTLTQYYHTDYRLILTGTPLQNNLPELWALLNFVLPKIFNSVKSFDEWFNTPFANTGGQDKIELSEEETLLVIRRLHKVLRPFLLRRLKKDVEKDLPNKVEKVIKCKMSAIQSKMYQHMLKYHQIYVPDEENDKLVPLKGFNNPIMQLRKICNHPFVFEEIEDIINPLHDTNQNIWRAAGKFELLERILPKFKATGHRVLIFFQMTQIMDIMEDFLRLNDMKYLRLDGSTKPDDRTDLLKMFNAPNSEYFAFLLSTRAGGLGLNLQTADTVIIFDTDWNPHQDLQAQDRAHRIGQKNEVRILRLITEDSVEEVILERAHQKLDIDGKVIQAGKFDNKSTNEEQEALLRALLESEESKKNGKEEAEDLDDDELNEILSRNESELVLFRQLDEDRKNNKTVSRLYSEAELPKLYAHDPSEFVEEINQSDFGRGARERKTTMYDDNLSEEQWLRQIDGYAEDDDGDDEDASKRKKKRPRKKATNEEEDDDEFQSKKRRSTPFQDDLRKPKSAPRTKKKGGSNRQGTPPNRVIREDILSPEDRADLNSKCKDIVDYLIEFTNEDGRVLSDIFLEKPPKKIYPDYYVLIKTPIAFDVIEKRIETNVYMSLKDFIEDVRLMFDNAKVYNEEGSVVYQDADIMFNETMQKYQEFGGADFDFSQFDEVYMTRVKKR